MYKVVYVWYNVALKSKYYIFHFELLFETILFYFDVQICLYWKLFFYGIRPTPTYKTHTSFFPMVQHRCSKTAQHIPYCLLTHRCHAATNTHITQCNSSNKYSNMVGEGMCGSWPPQSCVVVPRNTSSGFCCSTWTDHQASQ